MANYKIPNEIGQARQLNLNDTTGEIWSSKNIDLHTNPGKIKLARPMKQLMTDSNLGGDPIQALEVFSGKLYVLTDNTLYSDDTPFNNFTSASTSPQDSQDMVVFGGQLVIHAGTNIDAWDGSSYTDNWWTARGNPALTGGISAPPHMMEVLRIGAETLAVTDGSEVHAYTGGIGGSPILSTTVELGDNYIATCIKSSIRNAWIGTYTEDGSQALVFEWDGSATNYTQSYPVGAKAVLSMEIVDDVPILVTERGEIKMFNNSGFKTVAQFPFAFKPLFSDGVETSLIQRNNLARPIHPKGMKRHQNVVYIAVKFDDVATGFPIDERTPNGIWAFDLNTYSLSHLCSPQNSLLLNTAGALLIINERNGRIYFGSRDTDNLEGLWAEDLSTSSINYGYFTTPEIEAESITEAYNHLVSKALLGENDEIVVKYRVRNEVSYPQTFTSCVWATTTTFNTTQDLTDVKARYDAGERDEIEIVYGDGAGRLAQITKVEKSASTYTVTVDEAVGVAAGTSAIRFDNWKKIPKTMTQADGEFKEFGTSGKSGTFGQFKVTLKGYVGRPEIRAFMINTQPKFRK